MALGGGGGVVHRRTVRRRAWVWLLGLAWFLFTLAPYLPIRDHVMDYYLAVPAIGLGLIGTWAAAARDGYRAMESRAAVRSGIL